MSNKIIENYFIQDTGKTNDFMDSEVPYKTIYYLNDNDEIIKTESKYMIDFVLNQENIDAIIEHLKIYKNYTSGLSSGKPFEIFGFSFALSKLNGINPKVNNEP
jgi:hypothetical protein